MYNLDLWQWLLIVLIGFGCVVWWLFYWTGKQDLKDQNEWNDRIRADKLKHRQVGRVVAPPMDGRFPPVKLPFHKPAVRGKPEMNRRSRDRVVQQSDQTDHDDGLLSGMLFGAVIGSSNSDHSSHDAPYSGGGGDFGGGGASSSWSDSCSSSSDSGSSSCDSGGGGGSD